MSAKTGTATAKDWFESCREWNTTNVQLMTQAFEHASTNSQKFGELFQSQLNETISLGFSFNKTIAESYKNLFK